MFAATFSHCLLLWKKWADFFITLSFIKFIFCYHYCYRNPTENTHSSGSFEMINEANDTPAAEIPELNTETIETIGISSNDGNYILCYKHNSRDHIKSIIW